MDARLLRAAVALAAIGSLGASARTQHFLVTAPTDQLAQNVARAAEQYRKDLAIKWLGKPLGAWADVCPIRVVPNRLASGETSFVFPAGGGHPREWQMIVEGPTERILDSVLPHEILHTVFATHFQNPLPRWADEGACTTVEHHAERSKHDHMLIQFLTGDEGIPFNRMFQMRDYPRNILPLYSQGYSVARYLIYQGGERKFVKYVGEGMRTNNWTAATKKYYDFRSLSDLQLSWVAWVGDGSPPIRPREPAALASQDQLVSVLDRSQKSAERGAGGVARGGARYRQPREPRDRGAATRRDALMRNAIPGEPAAEEGDGWFVRAAQQHRESRRGGDSPAAGFDPPPAAGFEPPAAGFEPPADGFEPAPAARAILPLDDASAVRPVAALAPAATAPAGRTIIQWSRGPGATLRR